MNCHLLTANNGSLVDIGHYPETDVIVLLADGCYVGITHKGTFKHQQVYFMVPDAKARGLLPHLQDNYSGISYEQLLTLTLSANKVITWKQ